MLIQNEVDRRLKVRFGITFLVLTFLFTTASYAIVILDGIYKWDIWSSDYSLDYWNTYTVYWPSVYNRTEAIPTKWFWKRKDENVPKNHQTISLTLTGVTLRSTPAGELSVRVRHEVALLSVFRQVPWIPGMFLPVPTRACLPRVAWLVWSPTDNVPNWVQMATGESLGESSPVKG